MEPVGRVEFARPAEDQVTANFVEAVRAPLDERSNRCRVFVAVVVGINKYPLQNLRVLTARLNLDPKFPK